MYSSNQQNIAFKNMSKAIIFPTACFAAIALTSGQLAVKVRKDSCPSDL